MQIITLKTAHGMGSHGCAPKIPAMAGMELGQAEVKAVAVAGKRQDGSGSAGGFSNQEQFSLTNIDGVVLLSTSLTDGDTDCLKMSWKMDLRSIVDRDVIGYLLPEANMLDLSDLISEELSASLSDSCCPRP